MQKILVLAANPNNTSPLRLNEELREIKEGMRQAKERQQFLIESAEAVRTRDIHRSILNVKPNIIHFSGHGSGEQGLVFEDETGNAKLVDAAALARLFKVFASDVKCIVLNACYSQTQAEAIAQHIDYVIGMSQAIGDKAAIEFTVGFYDALGAGRSIEFAYEVGCSAIQIAGISESLTPKLLTKKQLNLQPSNQTLPSFSESDGSGQRVTVYKPPAPSDGLSSDCGNDYIRPEIVQSPQTDDLSSARNVDYTRLRDLLKAGNRKDDADYETYLVMLKVVGRKENDWIRNKELLNFPCTDLRTIDNLWVKYSNRRFGISVQKKIYLEVGGVPDGQFHQEAWEKFGARVGWRVNQTWIDYSQVTFDTTAPEGHLPRVIFFQPKLSMQFSSLALRLVNCNL